MAEFGDRSGQAWQLRSIVTEGLRNAAHGGARNVVLVVIVTFVTATPILAESLTLQQLRDDETALWAMGSHVILASSDGGIDGALCEKASVSRAVLESGAARRLSEPLLVANLADAPVTYTEVTPGFLRIDSLLERGSSTTLSGLVVAESTAESLGVSLDEGFLVRRGAMEAVIHPESIETLDYATNRYATGVLAISPRTGQFDTCFLLAAPGYLDVAMSGVAASVFTQDGISEAEVNGLLDTARDFEQLNRRIDNRLTRWGGLVAGFLAGLVWTLSALARRPEAGLYRSLGLDVFELTLLRFIEVLSLGFVTAAFSTLTGAIASRYLDIDPDLAVWATTSVVGVSLLFGLLVLIIAVPTTWLGDPINLVKDR